MNDIQEVTAGLMDVFRGLRDGSLEAKDAIEINNTAGKIISAYKVRLAYHALRGEAPEIDGLQSVDVVAAPTSVRTIGRATASGS